MTARRAARPEDVFRLHEILGHSLEEVARRLGASEESVRSVLADLRREAAEDLCAQDAPQEVGRQLRRYDHLYHSALRQHSTALTEAGRSRSLAFALQVLERRAAFLLGVGRLPHRTKPIEWRIRSAPELPELDPGQLSALRDPRRRRKVLSFVRRLNAFAAGEGAASMPAFGEEGEVAPD